MQVLNKVNPSPKQMQEFFEGKDEAPFVMINLLKFKPRAEYADGDHGLSGYEAYAIYGAAVSKLIWALGGKMGYNGQVDGLLLGEVEELWDAVALAQYPSKAAMLKMVTSPEYREAAKHREAGLAGQLNIRTNGSL
ncbi:MAG: hypothetical protein FD163_2307 [Hyphomonadaceae bacterium]|nr:MAG: hypothetical protein FD128_492 [Hyphomonadaceae bacterium]KAF0183587.1 MAG: hypothetical protein FD163_2307 [Hyphomonadaceae bacterium]